MRYWLYSFVVISAAAVPWVAAMALIIALHPKTERVVPLNYGPPPQQYPQQGYSKMCPLSGGHRDAPVVISDDELDDLINNSQCWEPL
jgi:hypothetical protein